MHFSCISIVSKAGKTHVRKELVDFVPIKEMDEYAFDRPTGLHTEVQSNHPKRPPRVHLRGHERSCSQQGLVHHKTRRQKLGL